MKYKMNKAIVVGDFDNQICVDELEVVSISMNFHELVVGRDHATLSVVMRHPASGWTHTVTYKDEHVGAFWVAVDGVSNVLQRAALSKMVDDEKLPPGAIVTDDKTT